MDEEAAAAIYNAYEHNSLCFDNLAAEGARLATAIERGHVDYAYAFLCLTSKIETRAQAANRVLEDQIELFAI